MKKSIELFCSDNHPEPGLYPFPPMPTGSGKTFNVCDFLSDNIQSWVKAQWANKKYSDPQESLFHEEIQIQNFKKVYFITEQLKNLEQPYAELHKLLKEKGIAENYAKYSLFIQSNVKSLLKISSDKFLAKKIPSNIKALKEYKEFFQR